MRPLVRTIDRLLGFPHVLDFPNRLLVRHAVQVTSFGGSATTMLYGFLERHGVDIPMTYDQIPWKHQRTPPPSDRVPPDFQALYIFSDPRDATLSIFRRGLQYLHLHRMGNARTCFGATRSPESWPLEAFLQNRDDTFGMESQFHAWTTAERDYPILVLRFDALWQRLPQVFDFLGLPHNYADDFPNHRHRHSSWRDLEPEKRRRFSAIYSTLIEKVEAQPDLLIR